VRLATKDFLAVRSISKDYGPTSRARIAKACAVGDDLNFLHQSLVVPSRNQETGEESEVEKVRNGARKMSCADAQDLLAKLPLNRGRKQSHSETFFNFFV